MNWVLHLIRRHLQTAHSADSGKESIKCMHTVVECTSLLDTQPHCNGHSMLLENRPQFQASLLTINQIMPSMVRRKRSTQSREGSTCIQSTTNCTHARPASNIDSHSSYIRPPHTCSSSAINSPGRGYLSSLVLHYQMMAEHILMQGNV